MTAKLRRLLSGETGSDRGTEILRAAVLYDRTDVPRLIPDDGFVRSVASTVEQGPGRYALDQHR
jgi:hypothetical protein